MIDRYTSTDIEALLGNLHRELNDIFNSIWEADMMRSHGVLRRLGDRMVKSLDESDEEHALRVVEREQLPQRLRDMQGYRLGRFSATIDAVLEKYARMGLPADLVRMNIQAGARHFCRTSRTDRDAFFRSMGYAAATLENTPLVYGENLRRWRF